MGGSIEPPFLLPKENHTVGQTARQSTLQTPRAQRQRQLDSTVYTKKTNTISTGDHHVEHDTRRRTVHRRKYRGSN